MRRADESPALRSPSDRLLVSALRRARTRCDSGERIHLRDLVEPLGPEALGLTSIILSLPFLAPISLGPLATPLAIVIFIFGWRLWRGSMNARLPDRLHHAHIPRKLRRAITRMSMILIRTKRRLARRRFAFLAAGERGQALCGLGIMFGAALAAVPAPMLPFNNALPGLGIILFVVGWLEGDGALYVIGFVLELLGAVLLAVVGILVAVFGMQVLDSLWPW